MVKEIEAKGRRAKAVQMDVTDRASVEAAARCGAKRSAPISILVNNAGINKPTDFDQVSDADWDDILATNLKGPFMVAQAFLPLLKKRGRRRHGAYRFGQRPVWRPAHGPLCRVQGGPDFAGASDRALRRAA